MVNDNIRIGINVFRLVQIQHEFDFAAFEPMMYVTSPNIERVLNTDIFSKTGAMDEIFDTRWDINNGIAIDLGLSGRNNDFII